MSQQPFYFDPIDSLDAAARSLPRPGAFVAKDARAARAWQRRIRPKVAKLVGFTDQKKTAPRPTVLESVDRGSYVRRKVVIRTGQRSHMPMYVLIPKNLSGPAPAVLALHGHGYGARDIVGLWEDGTERRQPEGYQKDFGCELARRGFVVAAPEISCFGERQHDYEHLEGVARPTTCMTASAYAMALGGSMIGWRVWEGMRAVDYLVSLKEVDGDRLGAMGISSGGLHTVFSTALDERIRACAICGFLCDYRDCVVDIYHCPCAYLPGLLQLGETSDICCLIAPRPCFVESPTRDENFPYPGMKKAANRARRAWKVLGAEDRFEAQFFDGRHRIDGTRVYDFLVRHLEARR